MESGDVPSASLICPGFQSIGTDNLNLMSNPRPLERHRPRSGFTLLELLLVLAILVALVGIVGVNLSGTQTEANINNTKIQIKNLETGIGAYRIRMNALPDTLDALRDGPSDAALQARFNEPIMQEIPNDAWGNAFIYKLTGNQYELRSAGVDLQVNTDDDIVVEGK
jgi:general secretion pathway protein G